MVYIPAGRLRHFQYPLGILQMGELRLPPERPWTAGFSISFTLAGNWKGRGHSLSLRTRAGNNTHLQKLILPSLPQCDLIHTIYLEQALDLITFYQWQLHMLSCRTQEELAHSHVCQLWESTRIPAEQLGWEASGMAEMILIHICRTDTIELWDGFRCENL